MDKGRLSLDESMMALMAGSIVGLALSLGVLYGDRSRINQEPQNAHPHRWALAGDQWDLIARDGHHLNEEDPDHQMREINIDLALGVQGNGADVNRAQNV